MFCCFTVKSFCNMSLPTAGMVIGWVCTVISLFQTVIITKADEIIEFARTHATFVPEFIDGSSMVISIFLTLSLLDLIVCVLLIIGINKGNHLLLLPWLINNGVVLALRIFFGILIIVFSLSGDPKSPGPGLALTVFLILVFLSLVWNAVYSLFQSFRKANDQVLLDTERLVGSPRSVNYELFKNSE